MIQEKYIELMNGELDGVNSSEESKELFGYMDANPEARQYFQEFCEAARIFDRVEELEPPHHLRKSIMAAIDKTSHVSPAVIAKENIGVMGAIKEAFRFRSQPSHAFAFAAGLLLGLVVFGAIWQLNPSSDSLNFENLYGSINSQVEAGKGVTSGDIAIDLPGISGSTRALYHEDNILIRLNLDSEKQVQVSFQYDQHMACQSWRAADPSTCDMVVTGKETKLDHRGSGTYDILLLDAESIRSPIRMQILVDGIVLSDQSIEPRRD